jgi:hypothetical protein
MLTCWRVLLDRLEFSEMSVHSVDCKDEVRRFPLEFVMYFKMSYDLHESMNSNSTVCFCTIWLCQAWCQSCFYRLEEWRLLGCYAMWLLFLVLRRATRHTIPEDAILHIHRREYLKFYRTDPYGSWDLVWV